VERLWTGKEKLQSKPTASSEPQRRGKRGDPSEFARKKHIHTRKEAGNAKHAASICSLQESEQEKAKKLMFKREPSTPRRGSEGPSNVTRIVVQLGKNNGEWENTR